MSLKLPVVSLLCPINAITMYLSWYPNILFYHRHSFFFLCHYSSILRHHRHLFPITVPYCVITVNCWTMKLSYCTITSYYAITVSYCFKVMGRLCIILSCFAMAMPIGPSWCCVIPSQCSTASSQCSALGAVIMVYVSHHSDMLFSCRILCPFLFIT